jgi:hypothetical protein
VKGKYTASLNSDLRLTPEQASLVIDRTAPFLDRFGMDRPITLLLQEAYMQGMRDTLEALGAKT